MYKVVSLSEAASLAIHSLVLIARSGELINVGTIAETMGSSRNHLAKVMQRLVKEGFVRSTRGPSGGFVLNRRPEEITLLEIYECIEGPIIPSGCPLNRQVCPNNKCLMGGIITQTTNMIKEYLAERYLSEFI